MLFISTSEIDARWSKIKSATEGGILGGSAKVATMKPNSNATSADTRVACVYTYDVTDEAARECGRPCVTSESPGRFHIRPTRTPGAGTYAVRGNVRISKRYE